MSHANDSITEIGAVTPMRCFTRHPPFQFNGTAMTTSDLAFYSRVMPRRANGFETDFCIATIRKWIPKVCVKTDKSLTPGIGAFY